MIQKKSAASSLDPFVWIPPQTTGSQRANLDQSCPRKDTYADYIWSLAFSALSERLKEREQEVQCLRQRLSLNQYKEGAPSELSAMLVSIVGKIMEISQGLFPGPVIMRHSYDPEQTSDEWLVFDVVAYGEYEGYRDRELQWHEEVEKIVPGMLHEFRLCVTPQR